MFDLLGQVQVFSELDLKAGFRQIRFAPCHTKTALKTKFDHFEFLIMQMDTRNASAMFQALMNSIF